MAEDLQSLKQKMASRLEKAEGGSLRSHSRSQHAVRNWQTPAYVQHWN